MSAGNDVALVTGGGRGIGLAAACRLANDGMKVAIADLELKLAEEGLSTMPGNGHFALQMDVSNEASVMRGFGDVEMRLGLVRVLVANAGIVLLGPNGQRPALWEMDVENWERTFSVNARGTFLCIKTFLAERRMKPLHNARIVTLSSVAAQLGGYRASAAYIASKSAIIGLTKAAAREGAAFGVTANTVAPGLIDAPMLHQATAGRPKSTETYSDIPVGRLGKSEEVAEVISFLASPRTSYVTGSVIDVNGGYRMQ